MLWSWAVRKGPSLDPADKRIAVHVEDHPLDYADFQGTIPDGQYGAGTVETWDRGTWEPLDDPEAGMRDGELKFVLRRPAAARPLHPGPPEAAARPAQPAGQLVADQGPRRRRARTARMPTALEQAAAAAHARPRKHATPDRRPPGAKRGKPARSTRRRSSPPSPRNRRKSDGWISEIKFDGYRLLARVDHGKVRL